MPSLNSPASFGINATASAATVSSSTSSNRPVPIGMPERAPSTPVGGMPPAQSSVSRPLPPPKKILPLIIAGCVVVAITIGLGAALIISQKKQENRSQASATSGSILAFSPAIVTGTIGQTFTLSTTINTDIDTVAAAELHISYDPAAVEVSEFVPGTALPVILAPATITNGSLKVIFGAQPSAPLHGTGVLGTFKVKLLTAKTSTITFANTTQVAAIGKTTNAIKSTATSQIIASAITPTAGPSSIPSITPIPTALPTTGPSSAPTVAPTAQPTTSLAATPIPTTPATLPTNAATPTPKPTALPAATPTLLPILQITLPPLAEISPTIDPNLVMLQAPGSQNITIKIDAEPTLAEMTTETEPAETPAITTQIQPKTSFFGKMAEAVSNFFRSLQKLFQ